jgi:hypothetical protein
MAAYGYAKLTDVALGQPRHNLSVELMHVVSVPGRRLRRSAAIIGPKWFTQRRIVSQETVIPRSAGKSSASRKLSVNRR